MSTAAKRGRPPKADKLTKAQRDKRHRKKKRDAKLSTLETDDKVSALQAALNAAHERVRELERLVETANNRLAGANSRIAELEARLE